MDWETLAALAIFYLDPRLLGDRCHDGSRGVHGALVWVRRQEGTASDAPAVRPAVIVEAASRLGQTERLEIIPRFHTGDPLRHHLGLVLQAASTATGEAERLYAEVLTNALAVHFLRRYGAARPAVPAVPSGLTPHKLRHITTYIKEHLDQALPLTALAAVVQMSPTYFARQFKQATGLTPHRYVLRCRTEGAQQLLTETTLPLIEVGHRVGFLDQSHFITVFRRHVGLTPRTYRAQTPGALGKAVPDILHKISLSCARIL